ncbi:MAG: beta-glucuronidase [Oscillospiraceae bacterium]
MTEIFDLSGKWDYKLINTENTEISSGSTTLPSTVSQMKLSPLNEERIDGYLGDPYKFEGKIVYSRKISLHKPNADEEFFLKLERTRISEVYINEKLVGTQNSFCTSHRYNITDYIAENENVVTIAVSNTGYPVPGGHMTSPDTQTNWLGILGEISVTSEKKLRAEKIRVFPKLDESSIVIKGKMSACGDVTVQVDGFKAETFTADGDFEYEYKLEGAKPWNEFDHNIYTLKVSCGEDVQTVDFGMKKYETNGRKLLVNGERAFLRGKHDGMIFPMTGAAPMDKASWLKVMKTAKEHGINHYRFHTCCPPEAAFEAADELGIYMEPELPFWGTVEEELNDGQRYLIEEGYRILDEFGSHPSFFALSLGNELWGSKERLNEILLGYKAHDSRHLYTQGSNNFQFIPCVVEGDDLFVGVRFSHDRLFRGSYAMCDAPLGHIQTAAPNSNYNYDEIIAPNAVSDGETKGGTIEIQYGTGVKTVSLGEGGSEFIPEIPVISHEVGQYFMYPDYNEIAKYTGVLKPYNFEIFRERLERAGLLHLADSYFKASGRFAAECYKNEIETALRSDELSGFQLLDLQDFTGQGTALVGILNSFMESKGVISPEEWRGFCSDRVVLGVLPKFVWSCGDEIEMPVMLYSYSAAADVDPTVKITLEADGKAYGYELAEKGSFKSGVFTLGTVKLTMPTLEKAAKARLTLETDGIKNGYDLWIFPEVTELPTCAETDWEKAKARLSNGEAVLFMPDKLPESKSIEGTYCTDFWNYSMFNSISVSMKKPSPVGTLGLLVDKDNAALNGFPSEIYSTAQWYDAVEDSRTAILDGLPIEPIVRTIDTNARNHSLGTIFEARTGGGRLLVCTARLDKKSDSISCRQLYKSLYEYVNSDSFKPTAEISLSELDKIFEE